MKLIKLKLDGAYSIELDKKEDSRGFFARIWCREEFSLFNINTKIAQINNSMNKKKGTLRGLHFQRPPKAEAKIVRCISGAIWDVIVDLRKNSPTFGKWYGKELNSNNKSMMYVPEGFAHGFQTLINNTEILYIHTESYSKDHEGGILFSDENIGIEWPLQVSEISEKDKSHPKLNKIRPIIA